MGAMKRTRFLWPVLALGVIGAAVLAVGLAAFNADRFRPMVVQRLQEALGRPVGLERLSLGWSGGIAFKLQGLAVYADEAGLKGGSAAVRAGRVDAVLEVRPLLKGDLRLRSVEIEGSILLAQPGQPGFEGRFSSWFDVSGKEILRTKNVRDLSVQGRIRLEDAKVTRFNLLRELFDRLTVIPGLTDALLAGLAPSYQEKLSAPDTLLQPADFNVALREGSLHFEDVRLATDSFELQGSGRVGLDGSLHFPAQIRIEPELSGAILRSVEELRLLVDESGRIVMPVLAEGVLPQISILPDLQYVAQRIFSSKAEDLLGGLLEKVLEKAGEE